jgi:hypothetical protein
MAKIIFSRSSAPTGSWSPTINQSLGSSTPLKFCQPKKYSVGGVLYSYTKGLNKQSYILKWNFMPESDYTLLLTFIEDVLDGVTNTFTYTDESGVAHTNCKLITDDLNWPTSTQGYGRVGQLEIEVQ